MESLHRLSFRFRPLSVSHSRPFPSPKASPLRISTPPLIPNPCQSFFFKFDLFSTRWRIMRSYNTSSSASTTIARAGWFLGIGGEGKKKKAGLPEIVKAGDPVLHEPAQEVDPSDVGSEKVQKIIDDMVYVMRKAPGVGLAAPQIGIPLRIIVLEDTREYISYAPKEEIKAMDRRPFDLLVIINPNLKKKSERMALFFEGCLSVNGYRAAVERYLDVEVSGLDRDGKPITVDATGWQARIFQHECDHLDGTLYVDKMVPKTFRVTENLDLPLADGCPKLGAQKQ